MRMQRSGLPLMILAGVILAIAAAVVLLVANPFGERSSQADAQPPAPGAERADETPTPEEPPRPAEPAAPTEAPDPEPRVEAPVQESPTASETAPESAGQTLIPATTWSVRSGDTLYDIAGAVWSDPFLWPLLLVANQEAIQDPDYLRPGQRVAIPAWVTIDSGLTDEQRDTLSEAHVVAYHHYRRLGSAAIGLAMGQPEWWRERLGRVRLNKAHWVLYSGLRYDEDLLERQVAEISDEDVAEVRGFVERFGLPPNRR